ncbi:TraR/DksA C4-type zinc finger protein [Phytohabitans sp. ZYX-F-186]|uniref:TraR/DksA C4-type zinc finger protein n=1 Tax=Phytohabitans maris TaxID=3071409 RepID=A0ABU0ZSC8_9ACTN|nr:TraR/DksA C4-type zinc finger protein [Phytohabitans sp. ZYX-F-186]MDQ7909880.1 TraR/DksA C4-type zinc finger protein [Phytohabitans sp. ZYX-F-186]
MTTGTNARMNTLRLALEEQYQQHTSELTTLHTYGTVPEHQGLDRQTTLARIEATRQALADTAHALKRIADGTYGNCERCHQDIPLERLQIRPHARFCVPCQQATGR